MALGQGCARVAIVAALVALGAPRAAAQQVVPSATASGRTQVIVSIPSLRDAEAERSAMASLAAACRRALRLSAADSAALVQGVPRAPELPPGAPSTLLYIDVIAIETLQPVCGDIGVRNVLAASRGFRLVTLTATSSDRDVVGAAVTRNGVALTPLVVQELSLRRLGPEGFGERPQQWRRLVFDVAQFAPSTDRAAPEFVVNVTVGGNAARDRVALDWAVLRRAWEQLLPARAAAGTAAAPPVALPRPVDPELQRMHQEFAAGDLQAAARRAVTRASAPDLSKDDRVNALAHAGLAFTAMGDTLAALIAIADLVEEDPCFRFSTAVPEFARRVSTALRPPPRERCDAQSIPLTVARSLVLPGFGRPRGELKPVVSAGILAAVIAAASSGAMQSSRATESYDRYLQFRTTDTSLRSVGPALAAFDDAELARTRSLQYWRMAAAIYVAQAIHATWGEYRLAARLRRRQDFGSPIRGRVSVLPDIRHDRIGVGVNIQW